jgi:hypothetical protein
MCLFGTANSIYVYIVCSGEIRDISGKIKHIENIKENKSERYELA